METPIETTDQGRTQIVYPPGHGVFSFFKAPAQSVTPLKSADVKGIYRYITEYRPAMQATDELRTILKDVREGKADIKEASDEVKSQYKETKDEVKSQYKDAKDEVKSQVKDAKSEIRCYYCF
mgnify:CR=1 FL=1